jgi:hypothetical protein
MVPASAVFGPEHKTGLNKPLETVCFSKGLFKMN